MKCRPHFFSNISYAISGMPGSVINTLGLFGEHSMNAERHKIKPDHENNKNPIMNEQNSLLTYVCPHFTIKSAIYPTSLTFIYKIVQASARDLQLVKQVCRLKRKCLGTWFTLNGIEPHGTLFNRLHGNDNLYVI